jgi:starch phosphorylase
MVPTRFPSPLSPFILPGLLPDFSSGAPVNKNNPTSNLKPMRASKPTTDLYQLPSLGMDDTALALDIRRYFGNFLGRDHHCRSTHYPYQALALALRDRLMERWKRTRYAYEARDARHAYYLSLEFLMGRTLGNALLNLGLDDAAAPALRHLGLDLEEMIDVEHDAGLGNGGLGRLAACFLDSCATLQLPVMGYGIRYEYGMFRQHIENGRQIEEPDHWLRDGNPWELERPEHTRRIQYGGRTESYRDAHGRTHVRWVDSHDVLAVPYDTPIPGYRTTRSMSCACGARRPPTNSTWASSTPAPTRNPWRPRTPPRTSPWCSIPTTPARTARSCACASSISWRRPASRTCWIAGSCQHGKDYSRFAEKNCFQLNDTHPSCAVPELMRLLMDEHGLEWEPAWEITRRTMAYTNHTLLPEALEKWPVRLFGQLLPRILEIIHEINARFLVEVARRWPGDIERLARMSLIEEGAEPQVRMAYLAIVGSYSVNGVAALHSELLRKGPVPRLFRALAPQVQQQDQRRHPAPLDGLGQSRPDAPAGRNHRRRLGHPPGRAARPGPPRRRRGLPGALARGEARQQGPPGGTGEARLPGELRPGRPVRRAGQAHPRIQAPVAQHPARHPPLRPPQAWRG